MSASCPLHFSRAGSDTAPVVVLGSSLGTTLEMWEPQVDALLPTHQVVRFDWRGHGRSPVPEGPYSIEELGLDLLAVLDRLGLEQVSYCGLSLGGMVGMWLAATAPERIGRLVLLCTSAHMPPASTWRERAEAVRAAGSPSVLAETVLERWCTDSFRSDRPQVVDRLRQMLAGTPAEGYAACCEAIARMDLRAQLPRISAPTLVIGAESDGSTPPEHQRAIASAIPGARLEILAPGAHMVSVERADAVAALLAEHLRIGAPA